ncbi:MAG: phage integrase N-terminal SAM-like domain-containing protein [Tepidisphaeraceae bacterium]
MKLLQQLDRACRLAHLARSTREQYGRWVEQFFRFHRGLDGRWRGPAELRGEDVAAFLTHMAVERRLSASSQNQAICALVFLYETVLARELEPDHLGDIRGLRSNRPRTLPTVLSTGEVRRLLAAIPADTETGVIVRLLYGTGMRIGEACTLRVRDVDFDRGQGRDSPGEGKQRPVGDAPVELRIRGPTRFRPRSRDSTELVEVKRGSLKVTSDERSRMCRNVLQCAGMFRNVQSMRNVRNEPKSAQTAGDGAWTRETARFQPAGSARDEVVKVRETVDVGLPQLTPVDLCLPDSRMRGTNPIAAGPFDAAQGRSLRRSSGQVRLGLPSRSS